MMVKRVPVAREGGVTQMRPTSNKCGGCGKFARLVNGQCSPCGGWLPLDLPAGGRS